MHIFNVAYFFQEDDMLDEISTIRALATKALDGLLEPQVQAHANINLFY